MVALEKISPLWTATLANVTAGGIVEISKFFNQFNGLLSEVATMLNFTIAIYGFVQILKNKKKKENGKSE